MKVLDKGVRIESDGTRSGTIVRDTETGEALINVQGVSFEIAPMERDARIRVTVDVPTQAPVQAEA